MSLTWLFDSDAMPNARATSSTRRVETPSR